MDRKDWRSKADASLDEIGLVSFFLEIDVSAGQHAESIHRISISYTQK
jgi:hypothetical protein